MPYKDPEKRKEYNRLRHQKNKEKIAEYDRLRNQNPNRIKAIRISKWKRSGLIDSNNDNYEKLYNLYLNTTSCDVCNNVLTTEGTYRKTMDHDHTTGLFRQILCNHCNVMDNWIKVKDGLDTTRERMTKCECGCEVQYRNLSQHKKSKKHLTILNNNNNNSIT